MAILFFLAIVGVFFTLFRAGTCLVDIYIAYAEKVTYISLVMYNAEPKGNLVTFFLFALADALLWTLIFFR